MSCRIIKANKIALNMILLSLFLSVVTAFLPLIFAKTMNYTILAIIGLKIANKNAISIPFKKPRVNLFGLSILLTVTAFPIASMLDWMGSQLTSSEIVFDTSQPIWTAIVLTGIFPAAAEEIVYRGVLQGIIMEESALYSVLISALFFAVTHFSVPAMMYAFFFGCIFALVRIITDNLLYTITMHAMFNIINICFAYMNEISLSVLAKVAFLVLGGIAFLVTMVMLFYINDISFKESRKSVRDFINKEGCAAIMICLVLTILMGWNR